MRITIDVPNITEQATAGKLQEVIDYLNILASDLNDMLANIDTDNLSNNLLGQIGKSESVDVSGFASVGYVDQTKEDIYVDVVKLINSVSSRIDNVNTDIATLKGRADSMSTDIQTLYQLIAFLNQRIDNLPKSTT